MSSYTPRGISLQVCPSRLLRSFESMTRRLFCCCAPLRAHGGDWTEEMARRRVFFVGAMHVGHLRDLFSFGTTRDRTEMALFSFQKRKTETFDKKACAVPLATFSGALHTVPRHLHNQSSLSLSLSLSTPRARRNETRKGALHRDLAFFS